MRIESIHIRNFRGIADAELALDSNLTVLVGANNSGKTTVLDSLSAVVTYRRGVTKFLDTDFRAENPGADVREAQPILLTLTLAPTKGKRFEQGETSPVRPQPEADGFERIRLRLRASYSTEFGRTETTLLALDPEGEPINGDAASEFGGFPFRELLPFRAFGTERDLRRGMGGRWSDWSLILNEVRPTPEILRRAASHFALGSDLLIANTQELSEIAEAIRPAGEAVGLPGSNVKLTAAPQDPAELLQQVMVEMSLPGASRAFSAERHGMGTQGALLFALYRLQVDRLQRHAGPGASAVLTVEEPEAHLHPTAQRVMANQIRELPGQVIVTSHSPDFVGRAQGTVAVMRSINGATRVREIDTSQRYYRDHPRAVFARSVLVTEGLEAELLPVFAKALDIDLDGTGIEVVNAQGQEKMKPIWEVFGPKGLGMPVVLLGDADVPETLRAFLRSAGGHAPQNTEECIRDLRQFNYFTCSAGECLELELAAIGQGHWIDETFMAEDEPILEDWIEKNKKQRIGRVWRNKLGTTYRTVEGLRADQVKAHAYRLSQVKYDIPVRVAELMTRDGTDGTLIPDRFRDALRRAAELAVG